MLLERWTHQYSSIRLHPTGGTTDRVATNDDVLPLSQPIELPSGEQVHQIHIRAGQVRVLSAWSLRFF